MKAKMVGATALLVLSMNLNSFAKPIVVAADGSGDFKDVQSAIDSVPVDSTEPIVINIKPGTYKQRVEIPKNKPWITLHGDDAKTTIMTNDWNSHTKGADGNEIGTFLSYSTLVAAPNFMAENITFENTAGDHGQALALAVTGDRETLRNCRLLGWQDTLYINNGRDYFDKCYIEGRVDFIFGNSTAVFDHCEIHSKNGGHVTAASTEPNTPYGYVFLDCTLTGDGQKQADLGRPWRWDRGSLASVTYIRCKMGPHIKAEGWNPWDLKGKPDTQPAVVTRYAEFGSMDLDGKPLDVSKRVDWAKQLTADEAPKFTVENVLSGDDHWNPNGEAIRDKAARRQGNEQNSNDKAVPAAAAGNNSSRDVLVADSARSTSRLLSDGAKEQYSGKGEYNVREYGAMPDAETLDTAAIQSAIDACAKNGGGTVVVPAGNYVTGTLWMRSNVTLNIQAGATLLGSQLAADYPMWTSQWEGKKVDPEHASLICGENLENVALVGQGTIDARGKFWWDLAHEDRATVRPLLFRLVSSKHIRLSGLTFKNSPMWTISPLACDDVSIDSIQIENPVPSPNTDGIDPDSCNNVRVSNCTISVGDDCVAIKSGTETDKRAEHLPCQNITFTNCTMFHGHAGIAIGSETSGSVRNVVVSNCIFIGTDRGIRIKSRRGRGGVVEDVSADNIVMDGVLCPFTANLFYGPGASYTDKKIADQTTAFAVNASTPIFRRFRFSNITAKNVKYAAAFFLGLPEMPIDNVVFQNVSIQLDTENKTAGRPEMAPGLKSLIRAGFLAQNVTHLKLADCQISNQLSPAVALTDVRAATLSEVSFPTSAKSPLIVLRNSHDIFLRGCVADQPSAVGVQLIDGKTEDVHLDASDILNASKAVDSEVAEGK